MGEMNREPISWSFLSLSGGKGGKGKNGEEVTAYEQKEKGRNAKGKGTFPSLLH